MPYVRKLLCRRNIKVYLNERYKTVKLDTIILICDAFEMTFQEFFNDELFARENLDVE